MANMSASILRDLVGEKFDVSPKNVILSGEMSTDWNISDCTTSGSLYYNYNKSYVYGFTSKDGFIEISELLMEEDFEQNANGTWEAAYGYTAQHLVEECPDALFFLVIRTWNHTCQGHRDDSGKTYTLYKSTDFSEIWGQQEIDDIERWSSWLKS